MLGKRVGMPQTPLQLKILKNTIKNTERKKANSKTLSQNTGLDVSVTFSAHRNVSEKESASVSAGVYTKPTTGRECFRKISGGPATLLRAKTGKMSRKELLSGSFWNMAILIGSALLRKGLAPGGSRKTLQLSQGQRLLAQRGPTTN
jgi:hypothetical protein